MRNIKFRVWDIDRKRMRGVADIKWFDNGDIRVNATESDRNYEPLLHMKDYKGSELKEFELMQYTGLKDKNNKEIYEGDIIEFTWEEDSCWGEAGTYVGCIKFNEGVFEVVYIKREKIRKYSDGSWSENHDEDDIRAFISWTGSNYIECLGNIYENPELLEG